MSFGFSIGDFITVPTLAWKVYQACKSSPTDIRNLSGEVQSLHIILKQTEDFLLPDPSSRSPRRLDKQGEASLLQIAKGCHDVLKDLEALLEKYGGLKKKGQRKWGIPNRWKWGLEDVNVLRDRLVSNTLLLNTFYVSLQSSSSSPSELQRTVMSCLNEILTGEHEDSVASRYTGHSILKDGGELWRNIREELLQKGLDRDDIELHREIIIQAVKSMQSGDLGKIPIASQDGKLIQKPPNECHRPRSAEVRKSWNFASLQRFLLKHRYNADGNNISSVLIHTITNEDPRKLKNIISTSDADPVVNTPTEFVCDPFNRGRRLTPLALAISMEKAESVHTLLKANKVDPNALTSWPTTAPIPAPDVKCSPLMIAAFMGLEKITDLLLNNSQTNIDFVDEHGRTALSYAAAMGHEGVVSRLLRSCNPDIVVRKDNDGYTPIALASIGPSAFNILEDEELDVPTAQSPLQHVRIVEMLLQKSCPQDIDMDERYGGADSTLLTLAVRNGNGPLVELFLTYPKVNVNARDRFGMTPIHHAAQTANITVGSILLKSEKVYLNLVDDDQRSALHYAVGWQSAEFVQLLRQYDTKNHIPVNNPDKWGQTPLSKAIEVGDSTVFKALLSFPILDVNWNPAIVYTYTAVDGIQSLQPYVPLTDAIRRYCTRGSYEFPSRREILETLLVHPELDLKRLPAEYPFHRTPFQYFGMVTCNFSLQQEIIDMLRVLVERSCSV